MHVLINNAGINIETGQMENISDGPNGAAERHSLAKKTLEVNYRGTKNVSVTRYFSLRNTYHFLGRVVTDLNQKAHSRASSVYDFVPKGASTYC